MRMTLKRYHIPIIYLGRVEWIIMNVVFIQAFKNFEELQARMVKILRDPFLYGHGKEGNS